MYHYRSYSYTGSDRVKDSRDEHHDPCLRYCLDIVIHGIVTPDMCQLISHMVPPAELKTQMTATI